MIGVLTYLFGGIDSGFGILILPFCRSLLPAQLRMLPPALCQLRRHPADIQRHCRRRYRQTSAHIGCPNRLGNLLSCRRLLSSAIFTSCRSNTPTVPENPAHENHAAYRRIRGLNQTVLNRVQKRSSSSTSSIRPYCSIKGKRPATHA